MDENWTWGFLLGTAYQLAFCFTVEPPSVPAGVGAVIGAGTAGAILFAIVGWRSGRNFWS